MFTGIVEEVGWVDRVEGGDGVRVVTIRAPEVSQGLRPGASVSVDGACLTAVQILEDGFAVEAIHTTLSRTIAGNYRPGSPVNLERALALGGRLDGHLVQGHVDGVGELVEVGKRGATRLMAFRVPPAILELTVLSGSIAINGISLTVNAMPGAERVRVGIIPHTWNHTNLKDLRVGDPVNVEGDLIGKYVGKMLSTRTPKRALSLDRLEEMGY